MAQRGVQTILHPSLSRRFRMNDRQLRSKRLRHDVFTDTMQSKYVVPRGALLTGLYDRIPLVQSAPNEIKE